MHSTVKHLCEQAGAGQLEVKNEAILHIAMLLEKSSRAIRAKQYAILEAYNSHDYRMILPDYLQTVLLSEGEQSEVVSCLVDLINSHHRHPSMIWALGKSLPSFGLGPLLKFLQQVSPDIDDETIYQALVALEEFLVIQDGSLYPGVDAEIRARNPAASLQRIVRSGNPYLIEISQRVLARLMRQGLLPE